MKTISIQNKLKKLNSLIYFIKVHLFNRLALKFILYETKTRKSISSNILTVNNKYKHKIVIQFNQNLLRTKLTKTNKTAAKMQILVVHVLYMMAHSILL